MDGGLFRKVYIYFQTFISLGGLIVSQPITYLNQYNASAIHTFHILDLIRYFSSSSWVMNSSTQEMQYAHDKIYNSGHIFM